MRDLKKAEKITNRAAKRAFYNTVLPFNELIVTQLWIRDKDKMSRRINASSS